MEYIIVEKGWQIAKNGAFHHCDVLMTEKHGKSEKWVAVMSMSRVPRARASQHRKLHVLTHKVNTAKLWAMVSVSEKRRSNKNGCMMMMLVPDLMMLDATPRAAQRRGAEPPRAQGCALSPRQATGSRAREPQLSPSHCAFVTTCDMPRGEAPCPPGFARGIAGMPAAPRILGADLDSKVARRGCRAEPASLLALTKRDCPCHDAFKCEAWKRKDEGFVADRRRAQPLHLGSNGEDSLSGNASASSIPFRA